MSSESDIRSCIDSALGQLDSDAKDYFVGMIVEAGNLDESSLSDMLVPFVESYTGVSEDEAIVIVKGLCDSLRKTGMIDKENGDSPNAGEGGSIEGEVTGLLSKPTHLTDTLLSSAEQAEINKSAWGFDSIRAKVNKTIPTDEEGNFVNWDSNIHQERKEQKEQSKLKKMNGILGMMCVYFYSPL